MATPNMSLPVPTVGSTSGPGWATLLNACMSIIDQHTHAPGAGVLITVDALNINADLPINSNNLTLVKSLRLDPQASALNGSADIGCLYEYNGDLYYNDSSANQIRLTQGGSIVGTAGSITGLPSGTASASYNGVSAAYIWQSATGIAANMDCGSITMRNLSPNSTYGLTLQPPSGLAINYAITLPALPDATNIVSMTTSGALSANINVDNSTLQLSSNLLLIKDQGVTQGKLAPRTTGTSVAAGGVAISSDCGTFTTYSSTFTPVTSLSVTITTTGRPVRVFLVSTNEAYLGITTTLGSAQVGYMYAELELLRGVTNLGSIMCGKDTGSNASFSGTESFHQNPSIEAVDVVAAGTYTYTASLRVNSDLLSASSTVYATLKSCKLVAYEI